MSMPRFTRRAILQSGAAAFALPALISTRAFAQKGTRTVNLQIGWLPSSQQIGEIAAKHLGFFEEEGIELSIQPGGPNSDGVAIVASGQYEIGQVSSSPALMLAVSQKIPIKCFAVGLQEHPHAFLSLPDNPIRTPKDMIGKKIGVQATSKVLLRALLHKNNISEKDVEVVIVGSDYTPLITGQVEAITGWVSNVRALKPLGGEIVTMRLWDCGVKLYAQPYYAAVDRLAEQPDLIAGFLRALSRGWGFAKENTEKAVEFLVKDYPNLNPTDELASSGLLVDFAFNEETKKNGWGYFNRSIWQDQIDLYDTLGEFTAGTPKLDDVVTEDILNLTTNKRPKLG